MLARHECRRRGGRRLPVLQDRRGRHPRRRRARDRDHLAFRDLDPQAPTHVLVVPRTPLARTPPRWPPPSPATAGRPGRRGRSGRRAGGARRGLPAGVQHRRGRPPDRLPRPPARARRPLDGWPPGMSPPAYAPRRRPLVAGAGAAARRLRHARHGGTGRTPRRSRPTPPAATDARRAAVATATRSSGKPLRPGERRVTAADARGLHARRRPTAPAPTTTAASCSTRTLHQDAVHHRAATSLPGQPRRGAPRDPVPGAARRGARRPSEGRRPTPGEGWTCFGGTGAASQRGRDRRRALARRLGARRRGEQVDGQGRRRAAAARARG